MKTKVHQPTGCAPMARIEELASSIDYRTPDWVPYTVAIPGTETSALDEAMVSTLHFSGLLRSCSFFASEIEDIKDEDGEVHSVEYLLDDAAERLDSAHLDWLENEVNGATKNVLDIEVRNIYGIDRFYPANDKAREMAEMLYGRKTLNQDDLIKLHQTFGFEIRLTNAVAHEWLKFATSKLAVQS